MHELAVTRSILDLAIQHANKGHITDLYLVIGQLSSMIDDSVQFYWDIISAGTDAEGATLHFRRIPAEMTCCSCGQCYAPGSDDFACPGCGSENIRLTAGEEFYLEAIVVESEKTGQVQV